MNKEHAVIKETEKNKYLLKQIVTLIIEEGYTRFSIHHHPTLWKFLDAQNPAKGYGVMVAGKLWH